MPVTLILLHHLSPRSHCTGDRLDRYRCIAIAPSERRLAPCCSGPHGAHQLPYALAHLLVYLHWGGFWFNQSAGTLATIWGSAGDLDSATLSIALVVGALPLRANGMAVAGTYLRCLPAVKADHY
jgi:hypothetical protein